MTKRLTLLLAAMFVLSMTFVAPVFASGNGDWNNGDDHNGCWCDDSNGNHNGDDDNGNHNGDDEWCDDNGDDNGNHNDDDDWSNGNHDDECDDDDDGNGDDDDGNGDDD
jgi:hypothetical protein